MSTPPRRTVHSSNVHSDIVPIDTVTVPVRERAACMCVHGGPCSIFAPGHALHLIQTRLASATPSEWVDAIVESADAAGSVTVRSITDAREITVWSGAGAARGLTEGTPVALHGRYHVLAVGDRWFNVLTD